MMESSEEMNYVANVTEDEFSSSSSSNRLVTLAAIMLVALIGNCIIVITLTCTRYRVLVGGQTSSRVSIFILNLAISDLAVCLITIPGEMIVTVYGEWVLGATACKLVVFAQIVALAGTIFNLSAMSYDRYLAICQPLRFRNSVSRAQRTIAVAWMLAVVLSIPQLFIFVQVERGEHPDGTPIYDCASQGYTAWWQRRVYFSCLTVCILVVPAALITFCYVSIVGVVWRQGNMQTVVEMRRSASTSTTSVLSLRKSVNDDKFLSRAKVRTIKLTLCIILTFVACWTPYFVVNNIRIHSHYQTPVPTSVRAFAETFALLNSALNPLIYMCFNLNVKKALQDICFCCCCDVEAQSGGYRQRHDVHTGVRSMLRNAVVNRNQSNATEFNSSTCMDDTTTVILQNASSTVIDGSPSSSVGVLRTTSRTGSKRCLVSDQAVYAGNKSIVSHQLLKNSKKVDIPMELKRMNLRNDDT